MPIPRYFFDIAHHGSSPDEVGTELVSEAAARVQAVALAGAHLRDHPELVSNGRELRVITRGANRAVVFTVVVLSVDCR